MSFVRGCPARTYKNHFGSWNKALIACGIEIPKRKSGMTGKYGDFSYRWKGGKILNDCGYVMIKNKTTCHYEREHRVVMENYLGRKLNGDEVIHHINEIKTDNRIENLVLMKKSEHTRLHKKIEGV